MRSVRVQDSAFFGHVSLEKGDGWIRPWRLPFDELKLFPSPDDSLVGRAGTTAGVRLRLRTDAQQLGLKLLPFGEDRKFDLTIDNEMLRSAVLPAKAEELVFDDLPADENVAEIWLPIAQPAAVSRILIDDNAECLPAEDNRPIWTAYGSSITHCGAAHSPSRTWPATAARARDLNLRCMGFGGNCHLEPMVARVIRDLPSDFISLKLGINVHGGGSLGPRTWRAAAVGLVKIIREEQPETPIAVVSSIPSPPREHKKNAVGFTLQKMREELHDAVQRLMDCGDRNIHWFEGPKLFTPDLVEEHLPDELHPDGDGYEQLGRNFATQVLDTLGIGKKQERIRGSSRGTRVVEAKSPR
jgi:hypothetical protein